MDEKKYKMVEHLNEPERILFFTVDEFLFLMFPVAVGIQTHHGLVGIVAGALLVWLVKKLKSNDNDGFLQRMVYWYLPSSVSRLRHVPPSYFRHYMG